MSFWLLLPHVFTLYKTVQNRHIEFRAAEFIIHTTSSSTQVSINQVHIQFTPTPCTLGILYQGIQHRIDW
jgi:hypothetical protein